MIGSGYSNHYNSSNCGPIAQLTYISSYTEYHRYLTLALLGRYTLTRQSWQRVQLDLLAGFTLEMPQQRRWGFRTDMGSNGRPDTIFYRGAPYRTAAGLLSAGASVRCRLSSHLEAAYEGQLGAWLPVSRYFHLTNSLGLRYRFGQPTLR